MSLWLLQVRFDLHIFHAILNKSKGFWSLLNAPEKRYDQENYQSLSVNRLKAHVLVKSDWSAASDVEKQVQQSSSLLQLRNICVVHLMWKHIEFLCEREKTFAALEKRKRFKSLCKDQSKRQPWLYHALLGLNHFGKQSAPAITTQARLHWLEARVLAVLVS